MFAAWVFYLINFRLFHQISKSLHI